MIKTVAIGVGLLLLFATAHLTVLKTSGYHDPHALLVMSIAAGVGTGALALGGAWGEGRFVLASLIFLAMLCGELFGLAQTGDRIAAEREQRQAPARAQLEARKKAAARLEAVNAKMAALPETSPRLRAAIAQKEAADRATLEKSAEKQCASHCRALLEQQVSGAEHELSAARSELQAERGKAERELAAARGSLEAIPLPASGTPLADRLGVDAAKLDMIVAALGSLGANGLAACLLAFGAHRPRRVEVSTPVMFPSTERRKRESAASGLMPSPLLAPPERSARQHAAEFSVRCLKPSPYDALPLTHLHDRYKGWCDRHGYMRLPPADLAREIGALFTENGIPIEPLGGVLVVRGVALAD